jgi:hypothetical protein
VVAAVDRLASAFSFWFDVKVPQTRCAPLPLVVLGVVFPRDGSSFLAVHNALISLASMRMAYHRRSRQFICGATYMRRG